MAGYYTDIITVEAPSSAGTGETVPVTIKVKNKWTTSIHVWAFGIYDSAVRFIEKKELIPAGSTRSFSGSFVMPSRDVTIHAYSWYKDVDGFWHYDDEEEKKVSLKAVWQRLDTKLITISPAPVGWVLLDSKIITIEGIAAWLKLTSKTITIQPAEVSGKNIFRDLAVEFKKH